MLLLLGGEERLSDITGRLGLLPLADRGHSVIQRDKAWMAVGVSLPQLRSRVSGWVYLPIALGCVAALYVLLNIVPIRDVYTSIEWPVIVLLGSMIPIGGALQSTGGTALIAGGIVDLSAGFSPVVVLTLLVVVTMTLSDVMNNTATAVIAAPIAVEIAVATRGESGPVSDGRCGRGILRFPDADRAQEQYADHGAGRLSLWRLLANGPAARDPDRRCVGAGHRLFLADCRLQFMSTACRHSHESGSKTDTATPLRAPHSSAVFVTLLIII